MAITMGQSHFFNPSREARMPPKMPPIVSPITPTVPCTSPYSWGESPSPPAEGESTRNSDDTLASSPSGIR